MQDTPIDTWFRRTDEVGKTYVSYHRLWNRDVYIAEQNRNMVALNEKFESENPGSVGLAKCEQITEEQYKALK